MQQIHIKFLLDYHLIFFIIILKKTIQYFILTKIIASLMLIKTY
jgi:hypothetical protein